MEARRAIVAHASVAEGLEHQRSAWLLAAGDGDAELAHAIRALSSDPERARRLGCAARAQLESHHPWPGIAEQTLALVEEAIRRRRQSRV